MRVMMSYALRILRTSRRRQLYVGAHSAHLKWAEIKKVQLLFRNDYSHVPLWRPNNNISAKIQFLKGY